MVVKTLKKSITSSSPSTKNYQAIAEKRIHKPERKKPRYLVYSRNKKGKTYFCASAPNVLIADPEIGTSQMLVKQPDIWDIEKWSDLDELYKFLKLGSHSYEWVALDGVTRMHNMALRYVMAQGEERDLTRKPGVVDRRDYGKAGELTKGMLYNFHSLPMGVIFTAQERMEAPFGDVTDDEDSEDPEPSFVPDLPKGARGAVNGIVDVIGRMYLIRVENEEGNKINERRLWIAPHPSYDTGFRSDYKLPDYIRKPTVNKLTNYIQEGAAK